MKFPLRKGPPSPEATSTLLIDGQTGPKESQSSISDAEKGSVPRETEIPEWKPHKEEWLIVVSIFLLYLMIALDATIIVPVLSKIASDLGGTAIEAFWLGTSFLLTYAVFQPFLNVLSDIFGRRSIMFISISLFTMGTLIGCLAQNFPTLFAGRSIQGIGAGGIYAMGYVILSDIIPLRQRGNFTAIVQIAWAIGTILGPLLGGLFAVHSTWRWIFYINFPFCFLGLVLVPITVKLKMKEATFKEKVLRVDWTGGALFIGSTTVFLIAISWGGMSFPWDSAGTLVPLILGVVFIAVSLWWEFRVAKEPFLRKSLFYNTSAIASFICALIQGLELFATLYYLPLYFQAVKGSSAVATGVDLLAISSSLVPGSVITAAAISRTGRFRWAVWGGWVIITLGTGLFYLLDVNTKTEVWATFLVILGLGHGLVLSSLNLAVQAISKVEDVAFAVTMYSFLRAMGMALGVGIGGSVFQNVMSSKLEDLELPTMIAQNAEAFIPKLHEMADDSEFKIGVIEAYTEGIHSVFILLTALSGAAMLISLLIKHHAMDKLSKSDHTLEKNSRKNSETDTSDASGTDSPAPGRKSSTP